MKSEALGSSTSGVEVTNISKHGFWLLLVGLSDLRRYARGMFGGGILSVLLLVGRYRFQGYSRTLFMIDGLVLFLLVSGSRLSFRLFDEMVQGIQGKTLRVQEQALEMLAQYVDLHLQDENPP